MSGNNTFPTDLGLAIPTLLQAEQWEAGGPLPWQGLQRGGPLTVASSGIATTATPQGVMHSGIIQGASPASSLHIATSAPQLHIATPTRAGSHSVINPATNHWHNFTSTVGHVEVADTVRTLQEQPQAKRSGMKPGYSFAETWKRTELGNGAGQRAIAGSELSIRPVAGLGPQPLTTPTGSVSALSIQEPASSSATAQIVNFAGVDWLIKVDENGQAHVTEVEPKPQPKPKSKPLDHACVGCGYHCTYFQAQRQNWTCPNCQGHLQNPKKIRAATEQPSSSVPRKRGVRNIQGHGDHSAGFQGGRQQGQPLTIDQSYGRLSYGQPPPLSPDWEVVMDTASGIPFYHNKITGVRQWERPVSHVQNSIAPPDGPAPGFRKHKRDFDHSNDNADVVSKKSRTGQPLKPIGDIRSGTDKSQPSGPRDRLAIDNRWCWKCTTGAHHHVDCASTPEGQSDPTAFILPVFNTGSIFKHPIKDLSHLPTTDWELHNHLIKRSESLEKFHMFEVGRDTLIMAIAKLIYEYGQHFCVHRDFLALAAEANQISARLMRELCNFLRELATESEARLAIQYDSGVGSVSYATTHDYQKYLAYFRRPDVTALKISDEVKLKMLNGMRRIKKLFRLQLRIFRSRLVTAIAHYALSNVWLVKAFRVIDMLLFQVDPELSEADSMHAYSIPWLHEGVDSKAINTFFDLFEASKNWTRREEHK